MAERCSGALSSALCCPSCAGGNRSRSLCVLSMQRLLPTLTNRYHWVALPIRDSGRMMEGLGMNDHIPMRRGTSFSKH